MRLIPTLVLWAALLCSACASGNALPLGQGIGPSPTPPSSASAAPGWKMIVDFDHLPELPAIAEHEKILLKLVGPHVDDRKGCAEGAPNSIARLQGGLQGSFSGPGAKEVAYLVTTTSCQAPPNQDTDKHRLIILAGEKIVLDKEVAEHLLVAVSDPDADGDNELVLVSGKKDDARGSISARLVDTEGGDLAVLFDFGEVATTRCAGGTGILQSATIEYRVVGTSMEYRTQKRQKPCK